MTSFFRKRVNSLLRTSKWSSSRDPNNDCLSEEQEYFKKRFETDKQDLDIAEFINEYMVNYKNGRSIAMPEIYSGKTGLDIPIINLDQFSLQVKASYTGPDGGLTRVREQKEQPIVNMANLDDELCLSIDENSTNEWNDEPQSEKRRCKDYRAAHLESLGFSPGRESPVNNTNGFDWNIFDEKKAYGGSISLYETNPMTGKSAGSPIADVFGIVARENNCIMALADGVNWGEGAQLAARCGVRGAIDHINKHLENNMFHTTNDIFHCLLGAFHAGHALILQEGGSLTTLCVAIIAPVKNSSTFVLCVCNVGDSLCFVQNPQYGVREITLASHDISLMRDMRDAGGALGPVDGRNPQLHNLTCSMTFVDEGDIVFITSDGVSDNFDPVVGKFCTIKKEEKENNDKLKENMSLTSQLKNSIQNSVPPLLKKIPLRCSATLPCIDAKQRHELMLLRMTDIAVNGNDRKSCDNSDMIETDINHVTAKSLCQNFLEFAYKLTTVKRKALEDPELYRVRNTYTKSEERIRRRLIKDMIMQMPGKLDHSSIVAYKVGDWDGSLKLKNKYECLANDSSGISSGSSNKSSTSSGSSFASSRENIPINETTIDRKRLDLDNINFDEGSNMQHYFGEYKKTMSININLVDELTNLQIANDNTPTLKSPYEEQPITIKDILPIGSKPPSSRSPYNSKIQENECKNLTNKHNRKHRRNSLSRHTLGVDVTWFKKLVIPSLSSLSNKNQEKKKMDNVKIKQSFPYSQPIRDDTSCDHRFSIRRKLKQMVSQKNYTPNSSPTNSSYSDEIEILL
uniref:PPM-type phosphatase domain-containing protein n=1 Tax=Parastrongyloides trichosuri TaxID=131310 RepID=A0A0N4ZCT0_PARTI